jgi:toxin ParE1/3/4
MKLRFSRSSRNDPVSIGEWIAKENPPRAAEYVCEIEDACKRLIDFPLTGEKVGRFSKQEVRRKDQGSHLVLYTIRQDTIFVLRFVHGAQDRLPAILRLSETPNPQTRPKTP